MSIATSSVTALPAEVRMSGDGPSWSSAAGALDLSKSIVMLRDLILADQLPHFRATPTVKSMLQAPLYPGYSHIEPDVLYVLQEASRQLSTSDMVVAPLSQPSHIHSQDQQAQASVPTQHKARLPRAIKQIPCRNKVTSRCEDGFQDTFHNAEHLLTTIHVASGETIYAAAAGFVDRPAVSTPSSIASDYYSSNWATPHNGSPTSDHSAYRQSSVQYTQPPAHQMVTPPEFDDSNDVESDYAPPSVELAKHLDRHGQSTVGGRDQSALLSRSSAATSDADARGPSHRPPTYPRFDQDSDFGRAKRRLHQIDTSRPPHMLSASQNGPTPHLTSERDTESRPPRKRRRNDMTTVLEQVPSQTSRGRAPEASTFQVVRDTSSVGIVPPPPDLAMMQAYAQFQAQMGLQHRMAPQQLLPSSPFAMPTGPVMYGQQPLATGRQPTMPDLATNYIQPPPVLPQQATRLPGSAPPGYMLVRDQFGNAWYARPIQQAVPPAPILYHSPYSHI